MINQYLKMEQFKKELIQVVNSSELFVGSAYLIMKDVLNDLHILYLEELYNEKMGLNRQQTLETYEVEPPEEEDSINLALENPVEKMEIKEEE